MQQVRAIQSAGYHFFFPPCETILINAASKIFFLSSKTYVVLLSPDSWQSISTWYKSAMPCFEGDIGLICINRDAPVTFRLGLRQWLPMYSCQPPSGFVGHQELCQPFASWTLCWVRAALHAGSCIPLGLHPRLSRSTASVTSTGKVAQGKNNNKANPHALQKKSQTMFRIQIKEIIGIWRWWFHFCLPAVYRLLTSRISFWNYQQLLT